MTSYSGFNEVTYIIELSAFLESLRNDIINSGYDLFVPVHSFYLNDINNVRLVETIVDGFISHLLLTRWEGSCIDRIMDPSASNYNRDINSIITTIIRDKETMYKNELFDKLVCVTPIMHKPLIKFLVTKSDLFLCIYRRLGV